MKLLLVLLTIASVALAAVDDVAVNNFKVGILAKDQQPSDENLKTWVDYN